MIFLLIELPLLLLISAIILRAIYYAVLSIYVETVDQVRLKTLISGEREKQKKFCEDMIIEKDFLDNLENRRKVNIDKTDIKVITSKRE